MFGAPLTQVAQRLAFKLAPKMIRVNAVSPGNTYFEGGVWHTIERELPDLFKEALALNPKSATAHNYLGITASQKGWQEAAEKEMLESIAANPDYAEAHFNLAVIYATSDPPAKELARRHYARATSLGADPDPALEKLLR